MKKVIVRIVVLAILVAAGYGGYRYYKQMPQRQEQVATAKVQRGDVVIRAYTRGELRAVRSYPISAPNLFGTVQVTALAPMGALAHEKDLIVEYDDSERLAGLEEARLSVESVDESIKQLKANQGITQSQDALSLLKARYAVRTAELANQKNPVIDAIDAKKNVLSLDQAQRAVANLEKDIQSRQAQLDSQMAVFQETRNRNLLNVAREMQRIAMTKALTPITGLVAIKENRSFNFNFGQQMPDIREGDELRPGMPVADVLDLSEVEVTAKVGELDRANLQEGQECTLQLDSIPDKRFRGKIKTLSGTATTDVYSGDPSKKFDVVFSVDMRELLTGLGMKPAEVDTIMQTAAENAKKNLGSGAAGGRRGGDQGQGAEAGGRGVARGTRRGGTEAGGQDVAGSGRRGESATGGRGETAAGQGQAGRGVQGRGEGATSGRGEVAEGQRQGGRGVQGRGGEGQGRSENQAGTVAGVPLGFGEGRGQGRGGRGGGGVGQVGDSTLQSMMSRSGGSQYTEEERNNAKLPLPPERESQVQVLLRPGLLADVEITVEKIPDALHIPAQAIFQKGGKPTVYVQQKNGRFEPRVVQLAKQSESMMVLAGGVNPGEIVALSDPTATKSGKKEAEKKTEANPMGAMGGK
jgi:hypothetical protein